MMAMSSLGRFWRTVASNISKVAASCCLSASGDAAAVCAVAIIDFMLCRRNYGT